MTAFGAGRTPGTPLLRRAYGLETEFGLVCVAGGSKTHDNDRAARALFRPFSGQSRTSNMYLECGARLYLDVGSHPEFATAECDDILQLIAYDRGGERIMLALTAAAQAQMIAAGETGQLRLFKNNVDRVDNTYGCHENFLVDRRVSFPLLVDVLTPLLVTRQLLCGAGMVTGRRFLLSQRASHLWESSNSGTTRNRPFINTRDEPHADPEQFRRLHVIAGDANLVDGSALLKVGCVDLVLAAVESKLLPKPPVVLRSPFEAVRAVASGAPFNARMERADGTTVGALDVQYEYLEAAHAFAARFDVGETRRLVLQLWERVLDHLARREWRQVADVVEWAAKRSLLERLAERRGVEPFGAAMEPVDLLWHDLDPFRGLAQIATRAGLVRRLVTDLAVDDAMETAPSTTRAATRGEFIRRGRAAGVDHTVDWTHLKVEVGQNKPYVRLRDPLVTDGTDAAELMDHAIETLRRREADTPVTA